ncbi:MAG: ExeM/NucH family extracellular endonuclease [Burkholderiales bacterium]|nr:ExeM/NucH family extracellular endonuclease [Burkholderiales bacterium]
MTHRPAVRRWLAAAWAVVAGLVAGAAGASASGVVISQVYGGNGNTWASDYVELFNAGAAPVDVTGWSVQYASATGSGHFAANGVTVLSGSIAAGGYYLVRLASSTGPALPAADAAGTTNLSGTSGKVILANVATGLACNGGATPCSGAQLAQIVDLVGYGGANFFEGGAAPAASSTTALLRAGAGCGDTDQNGADFTAGPPAPRNSATPAIVCGAGSAPVVAACPASLAVASGAVVAFPLSAADGDGIVSSAILAAGGAAGISLGAFTAAAGTGGTARVALALDGSLADGSYGVTVQFGNDAAQSGSCTIAITVAPAAPGFTPIPAIQGRGALAALTGIRTTRGVVTRVNNNGYFIQDPVGDGDPLTSDGIFVFTSGAPYVSPGQEVQVTGTVVDFDPGFGANPLTAANPLTELTSVTATVFTGSGSVAPTDVVLPVASQGDLERYEGMLVRIVSPLTASQNFFQGRYGQVTLSAGARLYKPTNLFRPGTAAAIAQADQNARSTILLDDGTSAQNPAPIPYVGADNTLRAGDTLPDGLTGVIDYGLATNRTDGPALYRIHPTIAPVFTRANPRSAAPPAVGGGVRVASFNVLNYFTSFGDGGFAPGGASGCLPSGTTADCRGADNAAEFARQRDKIIRAIAALDADVVGLMEIQRNGGVAEQDLVAGLNAFMGAGTYAVVPEPATGVGTDAIKMALIYKPAVLALGGAGLSDTAAIHNRPPIAQTFVAAGGAKFSVVVNHFKSKNCDGATGADLDQGDGQGCYNDRRRQQASALLAFVAGVKAAAGDDDVLVIGDLNAYAMEDPVDLLVTGGLTDQARRFAGAAAYSYVFDGEAGHLDHALASASMAAQVVGAAHWAINADEPSVIDYNLEFRNQDLYSATPYRASDHDPVLIGLALTVSPLAQTIDFGSLAARRLDQTPFAVAASASSGLVVSISTLSPATCTVAGGTVTLLAAGTCTLAADQPGDPAYLPAPQVLRSFAVNAGQAQSLTFAAIAAQTLGAPPFGVTVAASSGLPVAMYSQTPAVCTVAGLSVTLAGAGTCTLRAEQPGDATFLPAAPVTRSFSVGSSGAGGGEDNGDVPLPAWALAALALALAAGLGRRAQR